MLILVYYLKDVLYASSVLRSIGLVFRQPLQIIRVCRQEVRPGLQVGPTFCSSDTASIVLHDRYSFSISFMSPTPPPPSLWPPLRLSLCHVPASVLLFVYSTNNNRPHLQIYLFVCDFVFCSPSFISIPSSFIHIYNGLAKTAIMVLPRTVTHAMLWIF